MLSSSFIILILYHPYILLSPSFIILILYYFYLLSCSSFILPIPYHPYPLSFSSFITLVLYRSHPLSSSSFIIFILYHPCPLSSSSVIILSLYHLHPTLSSSPIILVLYYFYLSLSLPLIIYDLQIHPQFHLHYPQPYRSYRPIILLLLLLITIIFSWRFLESQGAQQRNIRQTKFGGWDNSRKDVPNTPKNPRFFRRIDEQKRPQFFAKWIQHKIHSPRHFANFTRSCSKNPHFFLKDSCKKPKTPGIVTKMRKKPEMYFLLRLRICSHLRVLGFVWLLNRPCLTLGAGCRLCSLISHGSEQVSIGKQHVISRICRHVSSPFLAARVHRRSRS